MDGSEITKGRHLGDGVYASFDGYHIWLAVNHHENRVVALEPSVLQHLNEYAQNIRDHFNPKQPEEN